MFDQVWGLNLPKHRKIYALKINKKPPLTTDNIRFYLLNFKTTYCTHEYIINQHDSLRPKGTTQRFCQADAPPPSIYFSVPGFRCRMASHHYCYTALAYFPKTILFGTVLNTKPYYK